MANTPNEKNNGNVEDIKKETEKTAAAVEMQTPGDVSAADTSAENPAPVDPAEELVEVELFYDGDKYKDPVPVGVNGVFIMVPRGKPVKIKRKYAHVLDHSMAQDRKAGKMQMRLAAEFESESKARDIPIE